MQGPQSGDMFWMFPVTCIAYLGRDQLTAEARAAIREALLATDIDDALLDRLPRLKVVARAGVGVDNIDVAACRRRGVEVR